MTMFKDRPQTSGQSEFRSDLKRLVNPIPPPSGPTTPLPPLIPLTSGPQRELPDYSVGTSGQRQRVLRNHESVLGRRLSRDDSNTYTDWC